MFSSLFRRSSKPACRGRIALITNFDACSLSLALSKQLTEAQGKSFFDSVLLVSPNAQTAVKDSGLDAMAFNAELSDEEERNRLLAHLLDEKYQISLLLHN